MLSANPLRRASRHLVSIFSESPQVQVINETMLLWICKAVYAAEEKAAKDRKRESFGDQFFPELLVVRKDKIRVEIRRETVGHHEPHMHVVHSDKIDASISLKSFNVLAGVIDRRTHKYLKGILFPKKVDLLAIWSELNEKDNCAAAEMIIESLGL